MLKKYAVYLHSGRFHAGLMGEGVALDHTPYTSSRKGNVCFSLLLYRSDCADCLPSSSNQLPSRD